MPLHLPGENLTFMDLAAAPKVVGGGDQRRIVVKGQRCGKCIRVSNLELVAEDFCVFGSRLIGGYDQDGQAGKVATI